MPEVSVIIPVYRTEEYLEQCIDSVLAQTFTDFEIILVDDGSPDNCPAICERYASEDSRIRVVHQENGGLSAARNTGLANAEGRYIYFLDSDDYILPALLETAVRKISCGYDAVYFSCYRVYDDGREVREPIVAKTWELLSGRERVEFLADSLLQSQIPWQVWNVLYDRRIIDENDISFIENRAIFAEDLNFNVRFCACAKRILSIPDALHYYRMRLDSLSERTWKDGGQVPLFLGKMSKNAMTVKQ